MLDKSRTSLKFEDVSKALLHSLNGAKSRHILRNTIAQLALCCPGTVQLTIKFILQVSWFILAASRLVTLIIMIICGEAGAVDHWTRPHFEIMKSCMSVTLTTHSLCGNGDSLPEDCALKVRLDQSP